MKLGSNICSSPTVMTMNQIQNMLYIFTLILCVNNVIYKQFYLIFYVNNVICIKKNIFPLGYGHKPRGM